MFVMAAVGCLPGGLILLKSRKILFGTFHLCRLFGIRVQIHWTWFVVAAIQLKYSKLFDHAVWHIVTYLSLFAIVLLHEFGHALACRSVGGQADRIILWPLGGIAFVRPPLRPGAVLWSIVAGPLVNVLLIPVTIFAYLLVATDGANVEGISQMSGLEKVAGAVCIINLGILVFNLLPIYPLDGGQILQSLLWFVFGLGQSLRITTVIGMIFAAVGFVVAMRWGNYLHLAMVGFVGLQSWKGFSNARVLLRMEDQAGSVFRR